jgi:uncharacterized MAPEG superfamily protein
MSAFSPVTAAGLASLASLIIVQVVVATASARKGGHVPGVPIQDGPRSFAFRAQRAHQNTLENTVPFLAALGAALAIGVPPLVIDAAVLVFVGARLAHVAAYYAGVERPRTAAFAVGLVAMLVMSVAAFATGVTASAHVVLNAAMWLA